jgi:hypothetical protein
MMILYCDHLGDCEQKRKLPLGLWSLKGAVTIKQVKKDVKWALDTIKLEKYLCFAIENDGNDGKLVLFHSYECQGI